MYIEQGYKGLTDGWRYIVGIMIVFFGWQILGGGPLVVGILLKAESMNALSDLDISGMYKLLGANLFLALMLLTFVIGLIALFIVIKFIHKQSITSLTTARKKIDWKRVSFSFLTWAVISGLLMGISIYFVPEDYVLNFRLKPFLYLLPIVLFLIPIQTSFEEYFMRGYLMQGLGMLFKNRWTPLLVTSLIFGLLHMFNPEVEKLGYGIMVYYIGTGLFLGILTLMDDGLELALGFHAANNMLAALLLTADWTAFQTDSVFKDIGDPKLGWDVFIPVLVIYPTLLFIFSKKYGWKNWKDKLAGKVLRKEEMTAEQLTDASF